MSLGLDFGDLVVCLCLSGWVSGLVLFIIDS